MTVAAKNAKVSVGTASMDRTVTLMMKPVYFDKMGEPASEQDKQNHEWNKRWLSAWKNDDFDTREDMIEEKLPTMFDSVKDVPIPSDMDLEDPAPYMEKLQNWYDEKVKADTTGFLAVFQGGLSIDAMQRLHPGIKQFFKDNPKIGLLADSICFMGAYFGDYQTVKYKINGRNDRVVQKLKKKDPKNKKDIDEPQMDEVKQAKNRMAGEILSFLPLLHQMSELAKDPPVVPYKKGIRP
jgi:hypothetical protein